MSDVYVVGVDMTKFTKAGSTRSVSELGARAALMALDDAGLKIQQMEALYCGNLDQAAAMVGQRVLQEIGQTGIPVVNVANACATGATAFREAWMAIKAGVYDVALAVGVEVMGKGLLGGGGGGGGIPKEGLLGSGTMPAVFAEAGMEHARKYGTTFEQFAKVSVKNHHHSTLNPKAMYQIETPLEMVMNAEMIAYPNTKLMCSVNVDGAASAVLVLGEEGEGARPPEARRPGARFGAGERSLAGARPGDARREHLHAPRRQEGLRDGRRAAPRTSTWSSSTTASRRRRSCTTRTSACARTARPGA